MNHSPAKPRAEKQGISFLPVLLIIMGCGVFLFAAWSAINSPVLASIMNASERQQETARPQPFAQVNIPKPSSSVGVDDAPQAVSESTVTAMPTAQPEVITAAPTNPPQVESIPTATNIDIAPTAPYVEQPTTLPETASAPSTIYAEIVADTPTPEYAAAPTAMPPSYTAGSGGEHWIDVDLSQQRVYAYEGDTVVNSFLVSTGTWQTPTVTGKYNIWIKLRSAPMSGPGYYLPNVPFVMYFYGSYGLHGTYWHNNFGTPMSHGCVNLSIPDAEWLYNFSSVGTVVNVHY